MLRRDEEFRDDEGRECSLTSLPRGRRLRTLRWLVRTPQEHLRGLSRNESIEQEDKKGTKTSRVGHTPPHSSAQTRTFQLSGLAAGDRARSRSPGLRFVPSVLIGLCSAARALAR